jgi:T5SS/PEP-CTERM-associated repeat protein/autotransporter-associated beta strand protein
MRLSLIFHPGGGPGSSWINGPSGGLNIGSFGTGALTIANGGRVINITAFAANIGNGAGSQGTVTVTGAGSTWSNSSGVNIGNLGTGTLTVADGGTVTSGGPTVVAANAGSVGTLNIGAAAGNPPAAPGTLNTPNVAFGSGTGTLNFNHTSTNYVFAPVISGNGAVNVLAGVTTLTANNTYTGATTINGGGLIVNGSIASSSLTTVNSGAALLGSGIVGSTVINSGGFFVPGPVGTPGSMSLTGNLAFQSGAFYVVQVNPTTASSTNVSGSASLAGTVGAIFALGTYMVRSYPILTAGGGLTGTFNTLATFGLPPDLQTSLSYTANTAFLNLRAQLVPEPTPPSPPTPSPPIPPVPGLPPLPEQPSAPPLPTFTVNQLNVGHAIDNFFNNGGALPPAFVSLFNLTGNNLTTALDQLSGEAATGAQKVAFQLTDQFLNLMLDPFVDGRSGVGGADHPALSFAPERETMPPDIALAYASVFKAPQAPVPVYEPNIASLNPAEIFQALPQRRHISLCLPIAFRISHQHADSLNSCALLCPCRDWPSNRAAEHCDELAPFQLTELHSLPQPGFSQHNGLPRIKGLAAVRHFDQTDDRCGSNSAIPVMSAV